MYKKFYQFRNYTNKPIASDANLEKHAGSILDFK